MRTHIRCLARLAAAVLALWLAAASAPLAAQNAPLSAQERGKMFREMIDLMEASALAMPELARAGAPLIENARTALETLESGPAPEHMGLTYRLLRNARVYVQLADALPKPPEFSAEVRKQLDALRAHVDHSDFYFQNLIERRDEEIRGSDRDNLQRYSEENGRLGPPGPNEQRVVFLGDSITDAWELNQYFPGKPYLNRGISGQITGQMLGRMKADVAELRPQVMVFLGGTNDLARGVPSEAIQDNIATIATLAEAHGITPVLASILPVSDHHAEKDPRYQRTPFRPLSKILNLNAWLKNYCDQNGFVYLNYHSAMVDNSGQLRAGLADDGLHPNAEGYKIMAPLAQAAIDQALAARKQPQKTQKRRRFGVF